MSNSNTTLNLDGLNPHPSLDFHNIYTNDYDRSILTTDEGGGEFDIMKYVLPKSPTVNKN